MTGGKTVSMINQYNKNVIFFYPVCVCVFYKAFDGVNLATC